MHSLSVAMEALPVCLTGGSAIGLSVADAWIRRPLPAMHQIVQQAGLIS
jgi:hypothetical protein